MSRDQLGELKTVLSPHRNLSTHRMHPTRRRGRSPLGILLLSVILLGLALPGPGLAEPEYTPARKVGRGFSNLGLGVLAIPGQMVKQADEMGAAKGVPLGFAMGLGWFVTTELVGVWEILTSPFEFPKGFRPIIEPEFPWEYFE